MNGKRTDWSGLVLLGIAVLLTLAAIVVRARLRRRDEPWTDDDTGTERTQVAVPVVATRAPDPVVVPVATDAQEAVPVPVAAAQASAGEPPFGPGSAAPGPDGGGPSGWTVKAKDGSRLYHTTSSPSWERMHADAWFESEEAAEAAGFKRWDWRRSRS